MEHPAAEAEPIWLIACRTNTDENEEEDIYLQTTLIHIHSSSLVIWLVGWLAKIHIRYEKLASFNQPNNLT